MENPVEEITNLTEESDSLLKKKKVKDPNKPKKVLSEGQQRALTAMNDARTKKAEEKLKLKYMKIMEKEQTTKKKLAPIETSSESENSTESEPEIKVVTKVKKTKEPKQKKKSKKKVIIIEQSEESDSESEPEIIYKQRDMKTQQNRRSLIQQHNEKQTTKNFFCN